MRVDDWWSNGWLVVKLLVERLTSRSLWLRARERERERERERIILMVEKLGRILVFLQLWTQFPPLSGHEIHPYLYGVEEEYVVFYGVKSWPLIQPRRILTSGSKWSL
jgi:hypothetical protein